jgi:hypothetical protein
VEERPFGSSNNKQPWILSGTISGLVWRSGRWIGAGLSPCLGPFGAGKGMCLSRVWVCVWVRVWVCLVQD